MARPNPLADPEFAKTVAQSFADGCTRREMAETFGVKDLDTISRWRRDPRVKRHILRISEDRVIQITRKVDARIEQILENLDDLDVKDIIAIRKEFLGGALRAQSEKADEETIGEAQDFMEAHPDLAQQLLDAFESAGQPVQE